MTNFQKKFVTAIATSAVLLSSVVPAFADTTLTISGNGAKSNNDASVTTSQNTIVVQSNDANVKNDISGTASTGSNDANDNTGGNVTVRTGSAKSSVDVSNTLNSNTADVQNCNCNGDTKVVVSGNGADSDNTANVTNSNSADVFQSNNANVSNNIDSDAKTGGNDANRNTGGDVSVITGNALSDVSVSTAANANQAKVGGNGASNGGSVTAKIEGNGAYSDNNVNLDVSNDVLLTQDNYADIYNNVDSHASTGWNDANDNTGGDVLIDTGWAKAGANVDNMVNFNAADVDCGCLLDVKGVVSGNGYDSYNDLTASLGGSTDVFQDNADNTNNWVDSNAKTGNNDLKRSTGTVEGGDPSIITGNAQSDKSVDNNGNVNVFGPGADIHLPNNMHLSFDFNLSDLLSFFGIHNG